MLSDSVDFGSVAGYHARMSTGRIVTVILASLVVVILLIVAGFWLWNESQVYRGNGTMYPDQ
jgi:hypothetical protein